MKRIQLRDDISATSLRVLAKGEKNAKTSRRFLAIAHLLDGGSAKGAQEIACLSEMPLRRWIHKFNAKGSDGLKRHKHAGRTPKINTDLGEVLKAKVLAGPSKDEGRVRYRLVDLQEHLQSEHQVYAAKSTIWYKLQELRLTWKTCRQRHPKSNDVVQEDFKKNCLIS